MGMLLRRYHEKPLEEKQTFDGMTVKELKALAKEKGIEHYSKLDKDELLAALKG